MKNVIFDLKINYLPTNGDIDDLNNLANNFIKGHLKGIEFKIEDLINPSERVEIEFIGKVSYKNWVLSLENQKITVIAPNLKSIIEEFLQNEGLFLN